MNISLDDLTINFPYHQVYADQLKFIKEVKLTLDTGEHTAISTYKSETNGFTVALLSLLVGYVGSNLGESKQIIYCTKDAERTNKIMETLKMVFNHRCIVLRDESPTILGVGFSSRDDFCVNDKVIEESENDEHKLIAGCRELTASWVREVADIEDVCTFFDKAEGAMLPPGIYSIQDLVSLGKEKGWCPYFVAKHALETANIVVLGYEHILDPKLAGLVSKELKGDSNSILIFDNADDLYKLSMKPLSAIIFPNTVFYAERNIETLRYELERVRARDGDRLIQEYERLINGVNDNISDTDIWQANPALPEDIMRQRMPEQICLPENFLHHLTNLVSYLDFSLKCVAQKTQTPQDFLTGFYTFKSPINTNYFKFFDERLNSLLRTLKIENIDAFLSIQKMCQFATLWGTYLEDHIFKIETGIYSFMLEDRPYNGNIVELVCTDASLIFTTVLDRFGTVLVTLKEIPANNFTRLMKSEAHVCRNIIPLRRR